MQFRVRLKNVSSGIAVSHGEAAVSHAVQLGVRAVFLKHKEAAAELPKVQEIESHRLYHVVA